MSQRHDNPTLAALAATFTPQPQGLLNIARAALADLHTAVIEGDNSAHDDADLRFRAAVYALNGYSTFGSYESDESAGRAVARECAAAPGAVPRWGHDGEFAMTHQGAAFVVRYSRFCGRMHHFEFHALRAGQPFISETGYRSHFADPIAGLSVDAAAASIFAELWREHRTFVAANSGDNLDRFTWLAPAIAGEVATYTEDDGQLGMVL